MKRFLFRESFAITKELAKSLLDEETPIPDGWLVHGRNNRNSFTNESYPTLLSYRVDIGIQYGRGGSVYLVKPKSSAVIADFSSKKTKDMAGFLNNLEKAFKKGNHESDFMELFSDCFTQDEFYRINWDSFKINGSLVEEAICSSFSPKDIVASAEAYDNYSWWKFLEYYGSSLGDSWPDFIYTPDGGVVIPGSAKEIIFVNLTDLVKEE